MATYAILINGVTKRFRRPGFPISVGRARQFTGSSIWSSMVTNPESSSMILALDHISFKVDCGEIFGVFGAPDAGKTTLVRLLATLLFPDSGDIRIFGCDSVREASLVRRLINPVFSQASFLKQLSPMQNLLVGSRMLGKDITAVYLKGIELLTRLGVEQQELDQPIENLSRTIIQKVVLARALISRPRLLLLDEPFIDLDADSCRLVLEMLQETRNQFGTTIFLTTKDPDLTCTLCDRTASIESGKIIEIFNQQGRFLDYPRETEELSMSNIEAVPLGIPALVD